MWKNFTNKFFTIHSTSNNRDRWLSFIMDNCEDKLRERIKRKQVLTTSRSQSRQTTMQEVTTEKTNWLHRPVECRQISSIPTQDRKRQQKELTQFYQR